MEEKIPCWQVNRLPQHKLEIKCLNSLSTKQQIFSTVSYLEGFPSLLLEGKTIQWIKIKKRKRNKHTDKIIILRPHYQTAMD